MTAATQAASPEQAPPAKPAPGKKPASARQAAARKKTAPQSPLQTELAAQAAWPFPLGERP